MTRRAQLAGSFEIFEIIHISRYGGIHIIERAGGEAFRFRMHGQVHLCVQELPGQREGRRIAAGGVQSVQHFLRKGESRLFMTRKAFQHVRPPAPVFHELGGDFHKIPRHAGSRQGRNGNPGKHQVQQVAELME